MCVSASFQANGVIPLQLKSRRTGGLKALMLNAALALQHPNNVVVVVVVVIVVVVVVVLQQNLQGFFV